MLAYFPVPYQDELLYSAIARYAVHTGQADNQKAVLRDVFGSLTATAISDLPSNLKTLTKNLSQIWCVSAEELIRCHTLAPLYLPFLRPEQADKIVESMFSRQGGNIHTRAGISAFSVPQHHFFRYCPACVTDQLESLGEPYWNRLNQIAGVNFCIKHRCKLIASDLQFRPKQKHLFQAAAKTRLNRLHASAEITSMESLLIRRFHEVIALQSLKGHSPSQWTSFYQQLAKRSGLVNGNRVDHAKIREKLAGDWKNTEFKIYFVHGLSSDWLTNIFRKHRKAFHPLSHLLVWCSLLPEMTAEEIVKDVGRQPMTEPKAPKENWSFLCSQDALTSSKREIWLQLIQKSRGHGIKKIRSSKPGGALYAWLYRHDRPWLMANRPPSANANKTKGKTDYSAWDQENIALLKKFRSEAVNDHGRQRFSRTFLIKQLPRTSSIEKHLSDLPETMKWLDQHAESVEEFQKFRINNAAIFLHKQIIPVKKWRLLRLAGIRPEKISPNVERLIQYLESEGDSFDRNKPEKSA
ncbi:TnsD family Tn7-like transposition protein [Geoalkalibacter halelectricus]|uniref:TnsD family transposase n=1 Tax=Geoalkalibacter halelectricus TaxID=2847045 RepID=A0ABY5ZRN3_9BACT|nr:TnsD family Tn7-like transposition protein [Geoalkalibacter halelectricus]MDO3377716.1 TnsD family transposase [Geoalkalibacter halelectricus]UWZ81504.1 TnsD family transposase [Geoalkalibacter halelectricus]